MADYGKDTDYFRSSRTAIDTHDDVAPIGRSKVEKLIERFERSLLDYDVVYPEVVQDAQDRDLKLTEGKLSVAVRNEMRQRGMEIPEVLKWKLRAALGGVEAHD